MAAHRYWRLLLPMRQTYGLGLSITGAELVLRSAIGGPNLALAATITARTTKSTGGSYVTANLIDGNPATWWASESTANNVAEWVLVDFGAGVAHEIVEVEWTAETGIPLQGPSTLLVQSSSDAAAFATEWLAKPATWTAGAKQVFTRPSIGSATARYWLLQVLDTSGSQQYTGVAELAFKSGGGGNLLTGGTATASQAYGAAPASAAVDGVSTTNWTGDNSINWWLYDFGSGGGTGTFSTIEMQARHDSTNYRLAPGTFVIGRSADGISFERILERQGDTFTAASQIKTWTPNFTTPAAPVWSGSRRRRRVFVVG